MKQRSFLAESVLLTTCALTIAGVFTQLPKTKGLIGLSPAEVTGFIAEIHLCYVLFALLLP